jgi:protein phosphatase 1 regulatory subunit 7
MDLTPEYIEENLEKIGEKVARDLLKQWILNSDEENLRIRALNVYSVVDDQNQFKFLEQLFLSDENTSVRAKSGIILRDKYFQNKKFVSLLEFTLNDGNDINQKLFALEQLNLINTKNSRKIIKDYLNKTIKYNFENKMRISSEEILKFDLNQSIPPKVLEICFNLILYLYYIKSCGYNATLRGGLITLLNCEGSKLESIIEIKGLRKLCNLEHLFLQRNNIREIEGLDHLDHLRTLNLSQNQVDRIKNLDSLSNLRELNLSSNKIKKIQHLNKLNLQKLLIEKNSITEIENIDNLVNLEHLNLSYNNISRLKNLSCLTKLKSLYLSFNCIEKISGLENLQNLTILYLNGNRILKIRGLSQLLSLKVLNLSNNLINEIVGLEMLENLIKLELSSNEITSLSGLDALKNLQELFVDKNHIKNMEGIRNLKSLIILFLEDNEITEFKLRFIDHLTNLNFIFLNQNPLNPESWELYQKKTRYP